MPWSDLGGVGFVRLEQAGLIWPRMVWSGLAWAGLFWPCLGWSCLVLVWSYLIKVWSDLVWFGLGYLSLVGELGVLVLIGFLLLLK
jgi:hypothetical protein